MARYRAFCGIDAGKYGCSWHLAGPDGGKIASGTAGRDGLRDLAGMLAGTGGALAVVDQAAGFAANLASELRAAGVDVARVTTDRFARFAALKREEKTDEVDAWILSCIPLEMPSILEPVGDPSGAAEHLRVLTRMRAQEVRDRTSCYNRLHALLDMACPPMETLLSCQALHQRAALAVLSEFGVVRLAGTREGTAAAYAAALPGCGPAAALLAGRMRDAARAGASRVRWLADVDAEIRRLAADAAAREARVAELDTRIADVAAELPEVAVLKTMPGMGDVFAASAAAEMGGAGRYGTASELAAASGIAKCPRESGKSKGKRRRKGGNRELRRIFMESARIAIRRPGPDQDYYAKKLSEGKCPGQALAALARKRISIMHAMIRDMRGYRRPS